MTFNEAHNFLRILLNIDADEFLHATTGKDEPQSYWRDAAKRCSINPHREDQAPECLEFADWCKFLDNPHLWFIRAPTDKAKAIWALVEARQALSRSSR
jgi:hypothetical protein